MFFFVHTTRNLTYNTCSVAVCSKMVLYWTLAYPSQLWILRLGFHLEERAPS